MAPLQLPESALPLTENNNDKNVCVLVPPSRAQKEEEDHTDATSCSSSQQDLAPRFIPITTTTAATTTTTLKNLPSAFKQNHSKGRWKKLFQRKKRVRFDDDNDSTTTTVIPPPPHEPLSAAQRKHLTWYNAVDIYNFQAAVDDLSQQLAANASSSWPAVYQALYEAAAAADNNNTTARATPISLPPKHDHWEAALDCVGMERLVTDHLLQATLAHRKRHRQQVLETQNTAPYNNASRLRKAVQQASLTTSAISITWAMSVAQMARRMDEAE